MHRRGQSEPRGARGPICAGPPRRRPTRMAPRPVGRQHHSTWHAKTNTNTFRQVAPSTWASRRGISLPRGAWVWAWVTLTLVAAPVHTKYVEGYLKTSEVGTVRVPAVPLSDTFWGRPSRPPSPKTNPPLPRSAGPTCHGSASSPMTAPSPSRWSTKCGSPRSAFCCTTTLRTSGQRSTAAPR